MCVSTPTQMFSYEYNKISKNSFLYRTPRWLLLDSNISNANLNKKQKKLFLYFDNIYQYMTFFIHC